MVKLSSPVTLLALSLGFSSVPAQAYPAPAVHCTWLTESPLKVKKVGKITFEPKDIEYRRDETAPMPTASVRAAIPGYGFKLSWDIASNEGELRLISKLGKTLAVVRKNLADEEQIAVYRSRLLTGSVEVVCSAH
jgi:hypothetical protein